MSSTKLVWGFLSTRLAVKKGVAPMQIDSETKVAAKNDYDSRSMPLDGKKKINNDYSVHCWNEKQTHLNISCYRYCYHPSTKAY